MLSVYLIQRHFQTRQYDQLLNALSDNGMAIPLPLRVRLSQSPASALGLGLRRLAELTYGPTTLSRDLTDALLACQEADGSFDHDPLPTAVAIAALDRLCQEHARITGLGEAAPIDPELAVARQRALAALAGMQRDDGLFEHGDDRREDDRALTGAFILWLLAGDEEFRAAVRFADLMSWFERRDHRLDEAARHLWRLARAEMAGLKETTYDHAVAA